MRPNGGKVMVPFADMCNLTNTAKKSLARAACPTNGRIGLKLCGPIATKGAIGPWACAIGVSDGSARVARAKIT